MAQRKYKITGFARFALFMLFFVPIAYFGLSLAKGEKAGDFMTRVKGKWSEIKAQNTDHSGDQIQTQLNAKDEEIQKLREELFQCQRSK